MMNVASLELCKELHELSGWKDTDYTYYANAGQHSGTMMHRSLVFDKPENLPAYDLGYLLRKMINHDPDIYAVDGERWVCLVGEGDLSKSAATPEDAAAKLAIELCKAKVLS